jgi:septum formation protein
MSHLPSPIYLASSSPRRKALLEQLGVPYEPLHLRESAGRARDVDETVLAGEGAREYVSRIAINKVRVGYNRMVTRGWTVYPILAADTAVTLGGAIFGKPGGIEEAVSFLQTLSGKTHEVYTAVALEWEGRVHQALSVSRVTFRSLAAEEIGSYIATGEPYDKAGGYAIQGRAASFIERLEGSYTGVMGLPLFETAQLLGSIGWRAL